jgi:hypothetical protein
MILGIDLVAQDTCGISGGLTGRAGRRTARKHCNATGRERLRQTAADH